jgi:hypothetical protein
MRGYESGGRVDEVVLGCKDLEGRDLEGQVLLGIGIMERRVGNTRERVLEVRGDWRWVKY